jgi:hypothetical protein
MARGNPTRRDAGRTGKGWWPGSEFPVLLSEEPWALLGLLLALGSLIQAWDSSQRVACIDYYQFWTIGQVANQGRQRDIYSNAERARIGEEAWQGVVSRVGTNERAQAGSKQYQAGLRRQVLETFSTPMLYSVIGLLSSGDYDRDQDRFQWFSLAAMAVGVLLLCRSLGYPVSGAALALALFVSFYGPTSSDVLVGNVNRLQFALVALFLWLLSGARKGARVVLAGLVLGSAVSLKPNLAFVALFVVWGWVSQRRYPTALLGLGGIAGGMALSIGLSSWHFGTGASWVRWSSEVLRLVGEHEFGVAGGNFALAKILNEVFSLPAGLILPILLIPGLLYAVWHAARRRPFASSELPEALTAALGCLASLLAVRLVWVHYYVLAILPVLFLLRPAGASDCEPRLVRRTHLRALAIVGTAMLSWNASMVPDSLSPSTLTLAAAASLGALCLLALSLCELFAPGAASDPRGRA